MTLQFAGPPLALPGEPEPAGEAGSDERSADRETPEPTAVKPRPTIGPDGFVDPALVVEERPSDRLRLDLSELEPDAADGWGRLRTSDAPPARPRSLTPPPLSRNDALDLVTRRSRPPSTPGLDLAGEMADRYALGDYTGALRVAELVLGRDPEDERAQRCAASSRERLLALYTARLASLCGVDSAEVGAQVPRVVVPEHEIRWLGLDHRQGFVLSRLDGLASVDELVDVSGMSKLELFRTLVELIEAGSVGVSG